MSIRENLKNDLLQPATVGGIVDNKGCAGINMTGGAVYNVHTNMPGDIAGRSAGYAGIETVPNCGAAINPSHLGVSKHHTQPQQGGALSRIVAPTAAYGFSEVDSMRDFAGSYAPITSVNPQCGGKKVLICSNIKKITKYSEVSEFWKSMCPGVVMLYNAHLKPISKKHHKEVLEIIKLYTHALCNEVKALNYSKKSEIKQELSSMNKHFHSIAKKLEALVPNALPQHQMIMQRHISIVMKHLSQHKNHNKSIKKNNKSSKKRSTSYKKHTRKNKHMKGGYHQYMSNLPNTPGYTLDSSVLLPGGANATPMPYKTECANCTDNYNHYTGKGAESPILDQAAN